MSHHCVCLRVRRARVLTVTGTESIMDADEDEHEQVAGNLGRSRPVVQMRYLARVSPVDSRPRQKYSMEQGGR